MQCKITLFQYSSLGYFVTYMKYCLFSLVILPIARLYLVHVVPVDRKDLIKTRLEDQDVYTYQRQ
jgi:hypothetical protein